MIKNPAGILPLIVIAIVAAGYAPVKAAYQAPEPRPLGRDLPSASPFRAAAPSARGQGAEPTGSLTLRDALVAALINSPELAAFSWELRAKEAEALQAGLRPNPEIGAGLENFGGSGDLGGLTGSETTIAFSQLIELGGKRAKRLAVAESEQSLAAWDYETVRIDVLTETTKAFVELLAAQQQLELAEELVKVAEGVLASVSRRVKAGSISPVEESRARVEHEISRIDRNQTQRVLTVLRKRLAATWGGYMPVFSKAVGDIESLPSPPSLELLMARVEQNPTLARWTAELDQRRASLELERSLRIPDLTLGGGVRYLRETGDAALVLELGVPIPVFDRSQGRSRAAAMRLERAKQERRAAAVRVQAQLGIAHEALLAAESESQALHDLALPEAEVAFRSAQDAYLRGSIRFTDVLDTKRLLFELKGRYFAALARFHGTVADIERLTGESIEAARDSSGRP